MYKSTKLTFSNFGGMKKVMLLKGIQFLHTIIGAYLIDPTVVQFFEAKKKAKSLYRLYLRKKYG